MDFAQQVKSTVDIVNVVREYVRLKKQGVNRWVGLCPFHAEKTPSFSVHEGLQIYKCFGCGKAGDVFNFLMELQGLTFYEALTTLAQQHGIPIPRRNAGDHGDAETRLRAALYKMHEIAQAHFLSELVSPRGSHARAYLEQRGLSPETAKQFGIGYAPQSGSRLAERFQQEGIPTDQMEASGIVSARREGPGFYDRFRDRLIFPILDENGRIIAFAGRALQTDQQPKYLNSPETAIYKKSSILYNFHSAKPGMRQLNRVILVEGYMDVIGVACAGIPEVVASCGTALTTQQARMIRRQADTVIVNFDADQAGQSATERSIEVLLQEDLKVRVLALPDGKDPDEFCKRHGPDAYRRLLDHAPDYFHWLADRARVRFDMRSAEGRVEAFKFLMPALNLLPDKLRRVALTEEMASYLQLEDRSLALEQIKKAAIERKQAPVIDTGADPYSSSEKLLIRLLAESADARKQLLAAIVDLCKESELPSLSFFEAMIAVEKAGDFQFAALEGRLDERQRSFLTTMIFKNEQKLCSLEEGQQAYAALQRKALEKRLITVRREIAEAEKRSDRESCLRLLKVRVELERELGLRGDGSNPGRRMKTAYSA